MIPDPSAVTSIEKAVASAYRKFEEFDSDRLLFKIPYFISFQGRTSEDTISKRLCIVFPATGLHYIEIKQSYLRDDILNCLSSLFSEIIIQIISDKILIPLYKIKFLPKDPVQTYQKLLQENWKKLIVPYFFYPIQDDFLDQIILAYNKRFSEIETIDTNASDDDIINRLIELSDLLKEDIQKFCMNFYYENIDNVLSTIPKISKDMEGIFHSVSWSKIHEVWGFSLEYHWLESIKRKLQNYSKKRYYHESLIQNEIVKLQNKNQTTNNDVYGLVLLFDKEWDDTIFSYSQDEWRKNILNSVFDNRVPSSILQLYGLPQDSYLNNRDDEVQLQTKYPAWKIRWTNSETILDILIEELIKKDFAYPPANNIKKLFCYEGKGSDDNEIYDDVIPMITVKSMRTICIVFAILLKNGFISKYSGSEIKKTLYKAFIDKHGKQFNLGSIRDYFSKYNKDGNEQISNKDRPDIENILEKIGITLE